MRNEIYAKIILALFEQYPIHTTLFYILFLLIIFFVILWNENKVGNKSDLKGS